jgi:hypothetical protein
MASEPILYAVVRSGLFGSWANRSFFINNEDNRNEGGRFMLCVKFAEEGQILSEHFQAKEFACSCCGMVLVHPELVRKIEGLRYAVGAPVNVTSGYRCASCNKAVGGAENSYHLFGMAADVWVEGIDQRQLAEIADSTGFDGIGIYLEQGFVHVDVRGYRVRWEG